MRPIDRIQGPAVVPAETQSAWEAEGRLHALRAQKSCWEIAWWLVEGQARNWDQGFATSMVILQRSRSTVENYYRVGLAWPRGKNHPDLSFSTHRSLLREPDPTTRALVMSMTLENNWFANDVDAYFDANPPTLRAVVGQGRTSKNPVRTLYVARKREVYVGAHVKCPCGCEHVFPIKGNKVNGNAVAAKVASRER